jgi:hypothetical protein
MLNTIFQGIFDTSASSDIFVGQFLLCLVVALVIGGFLALIYALQNRSSTSFLTTLVLLPAIVCVVIMLVNGNVGAGVAVAGAFSLVRFRSVPGTAREICTLFLAMGAGLICGMGYLGYAILFALPMGLLMLALNRFSLRLPQRPDLNKTLRITIPEDLDYCQLFDDLFGEYTSHWESVSVKSTNMGSLFKLTYHLTLKDPSREKEFLDALRCRNGNLEISLSRQEESNYEL